MGGVSRRGGGSSTAKKPGLLASAGRDLKNLYTGLPRGLLTMAGSLIEDAPTIASGGLLAGVSELKKGNLLNLSVQQRRARDAEKAGIGIEEDLSTRPGFAAQMGGSLTRSGTRLGSAIPSFAPGGQRPSETRLFRDYAEAPISTFVEDASNVALVAAPVAGAAGAGSRAAAASGNAARAGRLGKVADVAKGVATTGEKIGNAPLSLPAMGAKGVSRRAGQAYRASAAAESRLGQLPARLARGVGQAPEQRQVRSALLDAQEEVAAEQRPFIRTQMAVQDALPDPVEYQAAVAFAEAQGDALAALRDAAPTPEAFEQVIADTFGETLDPKAASLAADLARGTADPDLAARVDAALELGRVGERGEGGRLAASERYINDTSKGDFTEYRRAEAESVAPLPGTVDKARFQATKRLRKVEREAARLRERATEAENARLDLRAEVQDRIMDRTGSSYGRGTLGEGRRLEAADIRARQAAAKAERAERLAQRITERGEKAARAAELDPANAPARLRPALTLNRQVQAQVKEWAKQAPDDAAKASLTQLADELPTDVQALAEAGIDAEYFAHITDRTKSPGAMKGGLPADRKGRFQKVREGSPEYERTPRAQAQAAVDDSRTLVARRTVDRIADMPFARKPGTYKTLAEAADDGLVGWEPTSPFEKSTQVTANTVFVPEHVIDSFRNYFTDPKVRDALVVYDKATNAWKATALALNPRWNIGNFVSNSIMAVVGGGIDPVTLSANIVESIKEWRASGPRGRREFAGPTRIYDAGASHAEMGFLQNAGKGPGRAPRLRSALAAPARGGYKLNAFIDEMYRSATYKSFTQQGMPTDQAIREVNKALGDFARLTPFERGTVKRIMPFYPWLRHQTTLMTRLPIEHPGRVTWTLHMADLFGSDDELNDLPAYMSGGIPIGNDRRLLPSGLSPFSDTGLIPEEPREILGMTNPLLQVGIGSLTGYNLQTGTAYSRPGGTGEVGEYGNELPTAPSTARLLARTLPQFRAYEAVRDPATVRYASGEPVKNVERDDDRMSTILSALGLTTRSERELAEIQARREAARAAQAKARLRARQR